MERTYEKKFYEVILGRKTILTGKDKIYLEGRVFYENIVDNNDVKISPIKIGPCKDKKELLLKTIESLANEKGEAHMFFKYDSLIKILDMTDCVFKDLDEENEGE